MKNYFSTLLSIVIVLGLTIVGFADSEKEMEESEKGQKRLISEGSWNVGVDIPHGQWTMTVGENGVASVWLSKDETEEFDGYKKVISRIYAEWSLLGSKYVDDANSADCVLYEGMILNVSGDPVTFTPFEKELTTEPQSSEYIDFCCGDGWEAALKADGTVVTSDLSGVFSQEEIDEVSRWENIVDIESVWEWLVGLKDDGTVVEIGVSQKYDEAWAGVEDWCDIKRILVTQGNVFGLKGDGTVCVAGGLSFPACDLQNVLSWKNVIQLELGNCSDGPSLIALCEDGTVRDGWYGVELNEEQAEYASCFGWPVEVDNAVAINSSGWTDLCVESDGTVTVWGIDYNRVVEDTSKWTGIVQACAGDTVVLGLRNDGTVVYTNSLMNIEEYYGAIDEWTDIVYLHHANHGWTFGVRCDGTVAVNYNDAYRLTPEHWYYPSYMEIKETVESWTDIETIEMRYGAVIGQLRSGGVVVCAPDYEELMR